MFFFSFSTRTGWEFNLQPLGDIWLKRKKYIYVKNKLKGFLLKKKVQEGTTEFKRVLKKIIRIGY